MTRMHTSTIVAVSAALVGLVALAGPSAAAQPADDRMVLAQAQPGTDPGSGGMMQPGDMMGPGGMMGSGPRGGGSGMHHDQMFQRMDRDGDGALSRREFVEAPRRGAMSQSAFAQQNRATRFDDLDVDGNGRLTPDEMPYATP